MKIRMNSKGRLCRPAGHKKINVLELQIAKSEEKMHKKLIKESVISWGKRIIKKLYRKERSTCKSLL